MKSVYIFILIIVSILVIIFFAPSFMKQENSSRLADVNVTSFEFNNKSIPVDQYIKYIKVTIIKKVNGFVWGKIVIKYKNEKIAILQASLFSNDTALNYIVPIFSRNKMFEISKVEVSWDEINSK